VSGGDGELDEGVTLGLYRNDYRSILQEVIEYYTTTTRKIMWFLHKLLLVQEKRERVMMDAR
jgi:hypothetical protein